MEILLLALKLVALPGLYLLGGAAVLLESIGFALAIGGAGRQKSKKSPNVERGAAP